METVLIAGANGTTGRKIANLLSESKDYQPIAMVRKEEQVDHFKSLGIETVLGDLEKNISHAVKGVDKLIFAAGSGGKKVVEVDQEGAKKMIDASVDLGVKKFVMLSSMGADTPEKGGDLKDYLKAKQNADIHLRKSGLDYTIVRPGTLTNEGGLNYIELKEKLGESGEISRADVAETLVDCLADGVAEKATFEIIKGETLIKEAVKKV
ncbi:SDR family oxidoreductase [Portibacter lacus]|uniref:NAD dependent epimerase/dehydratase n=1 Tax=Portibacter lacus TaxID=1099794 RepID=A0AA37SNN7_9BACT|nr:SDR family oxidoreductase [Portibacter lacus]GLR16537.1 NAD dependent epimerase/dehydratase [Portibacter lacus]